MSRSFFGGDPNMAHYGIGVKYRMSRDEPEKEARVRRREQELRLKALGADTSKVFQFRVTDTKGKAFAKKQCEAYADLYRAEVDFPIEVYEGAFL